MPGKKNERKSEDLAEISPVSICLRFYTNKGADVCGDCPSGTYCLSGEGVQSCPAGHYCLGGGVEGILPCPPGTYSPQLGLRQVEQCLICPAGESIVSQLSLQTLVDILLRRCAAEMSFHLLNCNLFTVWV